VLCKMPHIFTDAEYADMPYIYGFCDGSATANVDGIFETVLGKLHRLTRTINTDIRNNTSYLFMNSFVTVQWSSSISENVRNRTHVHIHFFT